MGRRNRRWRRRYRRLPLPARISLAATIIPLAIAAACVAGLLRLRPLLAGAGGLAAAFVGFLAAAALLQPSEPSAVGPAASLAADAFEAAAEPLPAIAAAAGAAGLRLPPEPGARAGRPVDQILRVGKGDTLLKLMIEAGIDRGEAHDAIAALRDVYDPRKLRIGQAVTLTYVNASESGAPSLVGMRLAKSYDREAGAGRLADGRFEPFEFEKQLDLRLARASGTIRSSLFEDGAAEGVPARVMVDLIRLFSYDVDFQRDIHAGDGFDLLFERYVEQAGRVAREGDIRYASLTIGGTTHRLYRFETRDGEVDFFNERGESVRKALLRTPVDGARLSSTFGMRRHPILGYSRMHRGVDFAAPTGTPVMAAGTGTIEVAGRKGAYGKYVRIRHNGAYSTAYAHLNGFASGIAAGKRVKQGDVIGYIGSTGRSTGPHLHYEVLHTGEQINPMNLKLPSGITLAGKDLRRFHAARRTIDERIDRMPPSTLIAQMPDQ